MLAVPILRRFVSACFTATEMQDCGAVRQQQSDLLALYENAVNSQIILRAIWFCPCYTVSLLFNAMVSA